MNREAYHKAKGTFRTCIVSIFLFPTIFWGIHLSFGNKPFWWLTYVAVGIVVVAMICYIGLAIKYYRRMMKYKRLIILDDLLSEVKT